MVYSISVQCIHVLHKITINSPWYKFMSYSQRIASKKFNNCGQMRDSIEINYLYLFQNVTKNKSCDINYNITCTGKQEYRNNSYIKNQQN